LLAGLDPTGIGGFVAGFGDQHEVELLVAAGLASIEAICIAIEDGARFLQEEDIGTLAPGKQADLVVVRRDPSSKNLILNPRRSSLRMASDTIQQS
jgi:imidazolonepropionase-like amidohydrolase